MHLDKKSTFKVIAIILVNLLVIFTILKISFPVTTPVLSKVGSNGEEVKAIQQKLKEQGLFNDKVDGIFGPKTEKALKQFQSKNGLTADGIAGPQTLKTLGISSNDSQRGGSSGASGSASNADAQLLGRIISAEARGEPYEGQVAVGAVILNRIESPSFPDTLSGVIYQEGAFTAIVDGQFNEPIAEISIKAAKDALNGQDPTGGAIYYFNPAKTSNQWMRSRPVVKTIGKHLFCT